MEDLTRYLAALSESLRDLGEKAGHLSRALEHQVDRELGPGTWRALGGSWSRLLLRRDDTKEVDLEVLATTLVRRWKLDVAPDKPPEQRMQLRIRAGESGRSMEKEKLLLAQTGLLLAVGDMDRPQTIRLGRKWVVDEDGRQALTSPWSLAPVHTLRWLPRTAIQAATCCLMEEPWPSTSSSRETPEPVPLEEAILLEDVCRSPLDDLVWQEERGRLFEAVAAANLTAGEREILGAYLASGDWLEAARELDLKPSAMRERKRHLMAKLRVGSAS